MGVSIERSEERTIENRQPQLDNPADRGHLLTEQRLAATAELDVMSVRQILETINDQDAGVAPAVRQALPAIQALVEAMARKLEAGGRLIYVGAGTSGRLGVLDAAECPPTFFTDPAMVVGVIAGGDLALRKSSEGKEDQREGAREELERLDVGASDVVVGIAAGGTTPYVLGAVAMAKRRGATTGLVCCVALGAESADGVDHLVQVMVGPEAVTGSTRMKAGTATKLVLNMISTAAMVRLGKTWGNLMVDLRATNAKLRDRAARMLQTQCGLSRDAALALLDRADGRVKRAIVMARRGVDASEADRLLSASGGRLRPVAGDPVG